MQQDLNDAKLELVHQIQQRNTRQRLATTALDLKKLGVNTIVSLTLQNSTMAATTTNVAMWDDTTVELNDRRLKQQIPPLPQIDFDFQVFKSRGAENLAYYALQIVKSTDKLVIMRAMASACSCLLNDSANFTGSKSVAIDLTGLSVAKDDNADLNTVLTTNFEDSEPVTVGELLTAMDCDSDELGAYFGVLFVAGNKRVTALNRSAFNERRKDSAIASIVGDAKIFVADSMWLADPILEKVYASFLSGSPLRSNMTSRVIGHLNKPLMGPALSFTSMFLLLVDNGLSALRMIKEAVIKHPWIRTDFPELRPELNAANEAQKILRKAPGQERSFLKAIHGNAFVPVNYSQIDNLTGVCKEILKRTTPSYQNYGGGKITESQAAKINSHADVTQELVAPTPVIPE